MKTFLYLIVINSLLSLSCTQIKNDKNSEMKEFKCSFKGDKVDISNFLGLENINKNDHIRLQIFANQYIFLKGNESLKIYGFDKNTNILETFKLKEISTQLKIDRKYKMEIIDSTKGSFKLKITSGDRTFTQMKGSSIVIECISED